MKFSFEHKADTMTIELTLAGKTYRATLAERTVEVEIVHSQDGRLDILIDGQRITAYTSSENARRWVTLNGQTVVLTKSSGTRTGGRGHHHTAGELTAPMPGQVRAVNVSEGDRVQKGQTLLVLEAMKMEIRIHASRDGTVKRLFVSQGQTVEREQMLAEIEAD
jgi:3-methylcrotonyl-CoA carboxylase alpha subunit